VRREYCRRVQAEARKGEPRTDFGADLAKLDKQIADVADTIIAMGKSDVLTAKLRELEKRKRMLAQERAATVPTIVTGGVEQWTEIAANLARIGDKMTPDELETAREIVHDYIGEVSVVEEGEGVFGYVRLAKPRAGYKSGAQEAVCSIPTVPVCVRVK
jgi:hypothetical protein